MNSNKFPSANVDINECTVGTAQCSSHADCINSDGSYQCQCKSGYSGDGKICNQTFQDNSQCSPGGNECIAAAECVYKGGRYTCVCKTGYVGDGISCQRKDSLLLHQFKSNLVIVLSNA